MGRKTKISIDLNLNHIKIKKIDRQNGDYHIYVSCTATSSTCSKCGKKITKSHGQCEETIIQHMPILDIPVYIHVKWPRFICSDCDGKPTSSFHPDWLSATGTMTIDYEQFFLKMLINSTIKDTAIKFGTTEEILQGIIDRNIVTEINWNNINPIKIGIDEIALRKGHNHYLTIVSDISSVGNVKILAVLNGRKKSEVLPFLKTIPRKKLLNFQSICIDMGAGFFASLKEVIDDDYIFNSMVTIDRFHLAKLIGKAVDNERKIIIKDLKNKYSNDDKTLNVIQNTMWLLRHHFHDLSSDSQKKLDDLFELSPYLEECYELREELYLIFEKDYSKEDAKIQIKNWSERALQCTQDSRTPFKSFIQTYDHFEENILNYFESRASSGPVEGLNNKIKMIKRRGFGFRNVTQFAKRLFLDINYKFDLLPNCY